MKVGYRAKKELKKIKYAKCKRILEEMLSKHFKGEYSWKFVKKPVYKILGIDRDDIPMGGIRVQCIEIYKLVKKKIWLIKRLRRKTLAIIVGFGTKGESLICGNPYVDLPCNYEWLKLEDIGFKHIEIHVFSPEVPEQVKNFAEDYRKIAKKRVEIYKEYL
ncbi:MAG: hypothetical protein ACTSXW_08455 [Candidatus Baldrarchaeia archaeon]